METVEQLMYGLDARDRDIVALSLQGYLMHEIGEQMGRSESTVRRVLKRIRRRLQKMEAEPAES